MILPISEGLRSISVMLLTAFACKFWCVAPSLSCVVELSSEPVIQEVQLPQTTSHNPSVR